jgi:hypothetical protein
VGAAGIGPRGRWLVAIVVVLSAVAVWRAAENDQPPFVAVSSTTIGRPIPSGFIGLSLEFPAVPEYAGTDPAAVNPVLVQLIRNLTPGQAPVLRIGGDSTDSSWVPIAGVDPPPGVSYPLTPGWFQSVRALAAALGARLIVGVNLAADSVPIAVAEARAYLNEIGSRYIEALEIGNEPDLYGRDPWYMTASGAPVFARPKSYSMNAFMDEFEQFARALPPVPLAGPAFAWLPWMKGLGRFLSAEPGLGLVTFHRYPLRRCNQSASSPVYGSIPNLLSNFASSGLARPVARFAAVAHAHGLGFRVDELNSVSCHGKPGVSNSFASALWVLNTLFSFARAGVDGVNIHTFPGAAYQLFSFTQTAGQWSGTVAPEYYGLEMFAQAAPPGARLLSVNVSDGAVKAWATRAPDGTTRVVLINDSTTHGRLVTVQPPQPSGVATVETLSAPSATATGDVSIGGQSFGSRTLTGSLSGRPQVTYLVPTAGDFVVAMPPASAATLTLVPELSSSAPSAGTL